MKEKIKQYRHALLLLYFPFYLAAFYYIEHFGSKNIHIIESTLDHKIPFIEYFIIPYFLWFAYMLVGGLYFLFKEKESFVKMMYLGMIGMTTFIIVSLVFPNGLQLRPHVFSRENLCVDLVRYLYSIDTATNVFPSIHVYNSIGLHCVIARSESLKKYRWIQIGSFILCTSIVLATMFLKQHSVFDVFCAMALFCLAYEVVYGNLFERLFHGQTAIEYHISKR